MFTIDQCGLLKKGFIAKMLKVLQKCNNNLFPDCFYDLSILTKNKIILILFLFKRLNIYRNKRNISIDIDGKNINFRNLTRRMFDDAVKIKHRFHLI
jgi:hypothetical protein